MSFPKQEFAQQLHY